MWMNRYPAQNFFNFGGSKSSGGGTTQNNGAGAVNTGAAGNTGAAAGQGTNQSAAGNSGTAATGTTTPAISELDAGLNNLADLWKAPAAVAAATTGDNAPKGAYADFTDDALSKAFGAARVSTTIKPEILSSLFDGNQEKAAALSGILDQAFQIGLSMSAKNAMKLAEHGLSHGFDKFKTGELSQLLAQRSVQSGVLEANPMLANPAYKPVYDAMVSSLTAQYPNATQQEITQHATKHITNLVNGLAPQNKTNTNTGNLKPAGTTDSFGDDFFN